MFTKGFSIWQSYSCSRWR